MGNFVQQIIDQYTTAQQQPVMLSVIIAVATGLLICFFGYRLLRVWCAVIGFAAGALIAGLVAYAMGADVVLLVAVIAGIVMAILSFAFYKAGVFVIGFGSALNVTGHIINAYGIDPQWWMIILAIAAAVAVGMLAIRIVRPVVIISTSLSGSASIVTNILGIFKISNQIALLSATGVVAVLGIVYQFTHTKKKLKYRQAEETETTEQETVQTNTVSENTALTEIPAAQPAENAEESPRLIENTEEKPQPTEDMDISEYTHEEENEQ